MNHSGSSLVQFNFHRDTIDVVEKDDTLWVSVRRVCEALGIDLATQYRKLKTAPWARIGLEPIRDANGRNQTAFLVDLDSLPMWLVGITPSRVSQGIRDKLVLYQKDAARVLRDHFLGSPNQRRQREGIKTLALSRRESLALLKDAQDFGLLSEAYLTRYVLHSVALVDGTKAPDGPRLIDVSSFLESKGFDKETTRRFASRFGKKVRVLFEAKHGERPKKVHRLINGSERLVNSYTELDLPLFEQVFEQMFPGDCCAKVVQIDSYRPGPGHLLN